MPTFEAGLATTYAFHVDEPIPILGIPLAGQDTLELDFGAVYNRTFKSLTAYGQRVDYERLPEHFERYSPADQERIRRRMTAVAEAQARGLNLDDGPFSVGE
jgi:hypothetical protein